MAERIGPYGSNPYVSNAYGSVPHLRSAPRVPTEAEKALKIVDPHGFQFPTDAEKERFCEFFEISGLYTGNVATVQYFGGCYCAYLVPKGGAISDAQRYFANDTGRDGQNLLARAILLEKPSLILDLVACGAEVNKSCTDVNFGGGPMTPLFLAAQSGHTESIPALVQAGANINEVRPDYGSPRA
jgi:Ankyrin repeat